MLLTSSAFFWAGCIAVLIPVLLHFLMKGRPKREIFPAFQLIQVTRSANRRRFVLKHIFLLLLRSVLLVLLGLILARPVWTFWKSQNDAFRGNGDGQVNVSAVIVVDTSIRMEYQRGNQTRLEAAKEFAADILSRFPAGSRAALLDSAGSQDAFQIDLFAVAERIEQLQCGPERRPLADSVAEGVRLLSDEPGKKELYILTDRTLTGWKSDSVRRLQKVLQPLKEGKTDIDFFFADFSVSDPSDTALSGVNPAVSEKMGMGEAEISVDLTRFGKGGAGELELRCCGPGSSGTEKILTRPFTEDDFEGDSFREKIVFRLDRLLPGIYQGKIQKMPPDPLTADDQVNFTFEVKPPKRIVLVSSEPVERRTLFLKEAIAPAQMRKTGELPYTVETIPFDQFGSCRLDDVAALLFLDIPPLAPADQKRVAEFVRSGGGAGFFFGREAGMPEEYEGAEYLALIGGKPIRQVRVPEGVILVPDPGLSGGILSGFQSLGDGIQVPWEEIPFFRYWKFEWEENEKSVVPLRFSDGAPAVLERNLGNGRVLIVSTPFSDLPEDSNIWNRITTGEDSWVFLVLVDGLVPFLTGRDELLNIEPYQISALPIKAESDFVSVLLPDGETVPIRAAEGDSSIHFSGTEEIGSYKIFGEDQLLGGFSVNLPPDSCKLDLISFDELQVYWDPIPLASAVQREKGGSVQFGKGKRIDLQSILALLLGIVILSECAAAEMFYPGAKR